MIILTDDGTLDTVLRCSECGQEFRFNFAMSDDDDRDPDNPMADEDAYDAFVSDCIEEAEGVHHCQDESDEPSEEDIITSDYRHFYYAGKSIVAVPESADDWRLLVGEWCRSNGYFPDVWWISDHGNAHLISVSDDGRYLGGYADDDATSTAR